MTIMKLFGQTEEKGKLKFTTMPFSYWVQEAKRCGVSTHTFNWVCGEQIYVDISDHDVLVLRDEKDNLLAYVTYKEAHWNELQVSCGEEPPELPRVGTYLWIQSIGVAVGKGGKEYEHKAIAHIIQSHKNLSVVVFDEYNNEMWDHIGFKEASPLSAEGHATGCNWYVRKCLNIGPENIK